MPPIFRELGLLAWLGLVAGIFLAAAGVAFYLMNPTRPDSQEIRDFGVLLGFEVAALSFAVSWLIRVTGKRPDAEPPYAL
jgi:hypothetical protein